VVPARLWTWWDTVTLLAYEALALPVAFLVPGDRQLPAFLAGLLTLALIGRLFLIIAVGAINPTVNVTDRWWTARVGTAT
jgi:hypothetical protein